MCKLKKYKFDNKQKKYSMKCLNCNETFKSALLLPVNFYQCPHCGYKNDKNCFSKETKNAYDTEIKELVEFAKKCSTALSEQQCENIRILGKYGWSFYYNDIEETSEFSDTPFLFPQDLEKKEELGEINIKEIDKYFSDIITKMHLSKIKHYFEHRNDDKIKIKNAFEDFDNKKYFECASLLFGLIDSEIIKLNLIDNSKHIGDGNIKQGTAGFFKLYNNNFKDFLNSETISPKTKILSFEEFVEKIQHEIDPNVGFEFLNIAYPMLIFFNDNDWKDFPNNKPKVINRNWLAHGMYDYDDITEYDCKKLFLYYYTLSKFLDENYN